jgi:hypothetical protein
VLGLAIKEGLSVDLSLGIPQIYTSSAVVQAMRFRLAWSVSSLQIVKSDHVELQYAIVQSQHPPQLPPVSLNPSEI